MLKKIMNPRRPGLSPRNPAEILLAFSLSLAALTLLVLSGCKVTDPGTPFDNGAPTARITVAPQDGDTVNHYFTLNWAGNDGDGQIAGFHIEVDLVEISFTTRTDTTMAFASPLDSTPAQHTFAVVAEDDEGRLSAADSRTFFTVNYRPGVSFDPVGTVSENATVTKGFQIRLAGSDPNPSLFFLSLSTDSVNWTPWSADSVFLFADPRLHTVSEDQTVTQVDDDGDGETDEEESDRQDNDNDGRVDEDTKGLYNTGTVIIPSMNLPNGLLTIYGRCKDAGDALSPTIVRHVTVRSDVVPRVRSDVTGLYGTSNFYADGSIYFRRQTDIETQIVFSGQLSDSTVSGGLNSYRYQRGDSAWSDWFSSTTLHYVGLAAGEHRFKFVARDMGGVVSVDTTQFSIRLIEQHLTRNVLIVDETKDQGLSREALVDSHYHALFTGHNWTEIDYLERGGYLSPYDLSEVGLVMYHADDRSEIKLGENLRILQEYLGKGGRLILSGYDLMGPGAFAADQTIDSLGFNASTFGRDYLQLISTNRTLANPRIVTGMSGVGIFAVPLPLDTVKIPSSFGDALDRCWVFQPLGHVRPIATIVTSNPTDPAQLRFQTRVCAYLYDQSFRVAVFGVPLYFVELAPLQTVFATLVDEMLAGISDNQ
jgi:hypothetical protein